MAGLQQVQVWRGGVTASYINRETRSVDVTGYPENSRHGGPCLTIKHNLASKGGGTTSVFIDIGTGSFAEVISAMMKADKEATLKAIGTTLVGSCSASD